MRGLAMAAILCAGAAAAHAETPPAPAPAPEEPRPWSFAFTGGGLFPRGAMRTTSQAGLDVGGHFGWTSRVGLGVLVSVDYAPLRRQPEGLPALGDVTAQLFTSSVAPRFVLGRGTVRLWLAAGGGLVVERVQTSLASSTEVQVASAFAVSGLGGLDLHFFGNGGLTLAGTYTRALAEDRYEYLAVTAGLVFTL